MSFQENFLRALQEGINQCGGQQAFAAKSGVAQSSLILCSVLYVRSA